jgi:hypothetical protein
VGEVEDVVAPQVPTVALLFTALAVTSTRPPSWPAP